MSAKKITEKKLAEILSQLSSVDAQDTLIIKLLENGRELPESYIKDTAYHFLQKRSFIVR